MFFPKTKRHFLLTYSTILFLGIFLNCTFAQQDSGNAKPATNQCLVTGKSKQQPPIARTDENKSYIEKLFGFGNGSKAKEPEKATNVIKSITAPKKIIMMTLTSTITSEKFMQLISNVTPTVTQSTLTATKSKCGCSATAAPHLDAIGTELGSGDVSQDDSNADAEYFTSDQPSDKTACGCTLSTQSDCSIAETTTIACQPAEPCKKVVFVTEEQFVTQTDILPVTSTIFATHHCTSQHVETVHVTDTQMHHVCITSVVSSPVAVWITNVCTKTAYRRVVYAETCQTSTLTSTMHALTTVHTTITPMMASRCEVVSDVWVTVPGTGITPTVCVNAPEPPSCNARASRRVVVRIPKGKCSASPVEEIGPVVGNETPWWMQNLKPNYNHERGKAYKEQMEKEAKSRSQSKCSVKLSESAAKNSPRSFSSSDSGSVEAAPSKIVQNK